MAVKRLLFILPNLLGGGAERVTLTLLRELCARGYQVTLFLFKHEGVYWSEVPNGIKVRAVLPAGERTRRHLVKILFALLGEVRHHDVLVAGLEGGPTILAYLASVLVGKPSVGWVHVALEQFGNARWGRLERFLARWIYPRLAAVVCVSEGALASLVRLIGAGHPTWRTIPNPIQVVQKKVPEDGSDPGLPLVLAVGRLEIQHKGFDVLIRAHARLQQAGIFHRLTILGEGPDRLELETLAREEGVADSVALPGFVKDILPWYDRADVFVLSSRFEGLPTVILEALSRGVAVVATDCSFETYRNSPGPEFG